VLLEDALRDEVELRLADALDVVVEHPRSGSSTIRSWRYWPETHRAEQGLKTERVVRLRTWRRVF